MPLTSAQVVHFKALVVAWYHLTRRHVPDGFSPHSGTVGTVFRGMLREYQMANHLVITGELDTETQAHLTPVDPIAVKRAHSVAWYHWAAQHTAGQVYSEARPIDEPLNLYADPIILDCSGLVLKGSQAGGFANPAGFTYASGAGNTQSMIDHLRHIPFADLKQADIIVFGGPMPLQHTIAVVSPHPTNPICATNGHQNTSGNPCPAIVPYSYEAAGKPGQPVYALSVV